MDEKLRFKKSKIQKGSLRGVVIDLPAIHALQRQQDSQFVLWTPFYLLVLGGMCAGGWHFYNKQVQFETHAVRAEAEVIRLISSSDSEGTTYYPLYRFQTPQGEVVEFKDSVGSNPPSARVGDSSPVLYEADYPASAIVDRGWLNRLPGALALALGMWGLWGTVRGCAAAVLRLNKNPDYRG